MKQKFGGLRMKTRKSNVRIRSARVGDAPRMAELSGQLGYPVSRKEMAKRIAIVAKRKTQRLFVAEVDGNVEGWLEVFCPLSVLNWGKGEVGALVVDVRKRGMGMGKNLLEVARLWSKKQGCRFIYLRSNVKRRTAHRFYERAGYSVYKTQKVFKLRLRQPIAKD